MPRKRHFNQAVKPSSTAHPSLSSTGHKAGSTENHESTQAKSVNDLINASRRNEARQSPDGARELLEVATARTVHPSLKSILGVADVPAPKPRPESQTRLQRMVSPATNPFMTEESPDTPKHSDIEPSSSDVWKRQYRERLPGGIPVREGSLLDLSLKSFSRNWKWQSRYNQHYLSDLSSSLKELILEYIPRYGPEEGVGRKGFDFLFPKTNSLVNLHALSLITRLDLTGSLGSSPPRIPVRRLFKNKRTCASASSAQIESWDFDLDPTNTGMNLTPNHFANVTHLSLAQPNGLISWRDLLGLESFLAPLTHLSLAYWPSPFPNSQAVGMTFQYFERDTDSSDFLHRSSEDVSIACSVLDRLSKATYCLRWLDLTGCGPWLEILSYNHLKLGPDWDGAWRQVKEVVVKEGRQIPEPGDWQALGNNRMMKYGSHLIDEHEAEKEMEWIAIYKSFWFLTYQMSKVDSIQRALDRGQSLSNEFRKRVRLTTDYSDTSSLWDATLNRFCVDDFFPYFTREVFLLYVYVMKGYDPLTPRPLHDIYRLSATGILKYEESYTTTWKDTYDFISKHAANIARDIDKKKDNDLSQLLVSPGAWPYFRRADYWYYSHSLDP